MAALLVGVAALGFTRALAPARRRVVLASSEARVPGRGRRLFAGGDYDPAPFGNGFNEHDDRKATYDAAPAGNGFNELDADEDEDEEEAYDPFALSETDYLVAKFPLDWELDASKDARPLLDLSARDMPIPPEPEPLSFDVDRADAAFVVQTLKTAFGNDAVPLIKRCPPLLRKGANVANALLFLDRFEANGGAKAFAQTMPELLCFDVEEHLEPALAFLGGALGTGITTMMTPELLHFGVTETARERRVSAALRGASDATVKFQASLGLAPKSATNLM